MKNIAAMVLLTAGLTLGLVADADAKDRKDRHTHAQHDKEVKKNHHKDREQVHKLTNRNLQRFTKEQQMARQREIARERQIARQRQFHHKQQIVRQRQIERTMPVRPQDLRRP